MTRAVGGSPAARARARARGEACIVHNGKVDISVGLLKGPQKFQIQFLELHGGFSIVDNTELRTRARRVTHRPRGSPEIPSVTPKGPLQFPGQHCDFSIVCNTELATRARARGEFCIVHNRKAAM